MTEGVGFLHNDAKIMHRNLCPEAIVLTKLGSWKLAGCDFCVRSSDPQSTEVQFDIIVIIIALKGTIQDFLQSPHCAANCLQHVRSSGPGAIVCKSRATHGALITCNMS